MPLRKHEVILVFYKKLPTYNPRMTQGEFYQRGADIACFSSVYRGLRRTASASSQRYPTSVLPFSRDMEKGKKHPTWKPLELVRWLIKT